MESITPFCLGGLVYAGVPWYGMVAVIRRKLVQPFRAIPTRPATPMKSPLAAVVQKMYSAGISYEAAVHQFQERYICHILTIHKVHLGKSAAELRMHRNTLRRTLAELNMDVAQIRRDVVRRAIPDRSAISRRP